MTDERLRHNLRLTGAFIAFLLVVITGPLAFAWLSGVDYWSVERVLIAVLLGLVFISGMLGLMIFAWHLPRELRHSNALWRRRTSIRRTKRER
jgi:hypothetical protein